MKILVAVLVLAIIGALGVYMYGSAVAERNARFIHVMNDLKQAHMEVQLQGSFTNRFRTSTVQPFTNQFQIDGTNYYCEFAARSDVFKGRGLLAITTNQLFVWVDNQQGPCLLQTWPLKLPSGM